MAPARIPDRSSQCTPRYTGSWLPVLPAGLAATPPVQAACPSLDIVLTALRLVSPLLADDKSSIQVQCVSDAGQEYAAVSLPVTQATFRAPGGRVVAGDLQLPVAQLPCGQAVSCRIWAALPSGGGDAAPTTDELFSSEDPTSCWFPYRYFANGACLPSRRRRRRHASARGLRA